ncbi:hypothetical protein HYS96_04650 [Candidatus Daviesbacteria bacterium]|nr:hypothetical protein [Candidatus Daviesbacteria bacterium]
MKKLSFFLGLLLTIFIFFKENILAKEAIECGNRYTTLVNPVRGRGLWIDKTISPLKKQYGLIKQHNFSATWLLQYDALQDSQLLDEINRFDDSQEKGVFLEVSKSFAEQSRVVYPHAVPWFSPRAVFLSGYSRSDRRKLIDKLFKEFKLKFGFYPKSVGAWWIDSYSLHYMREKYGIKAALIVTDQKTTDNYSVWGQWWGVPYFPSKANILTPASSMNNKEDVVIIQWAQRDPALAYGEGAKYSNYSLQANDYTSQGKNTKYFGDLVNVYLDCQNPVGQITVGLETGIESVSYLNEYENQLKYLSGIPNLNTVTMSQFASSFFTIFPKFPEQFLLNYQDSNWSLKTDSRNNSKLGDYINYQQDIAFKDFFIPDNKDFLDRNLEQLNSKSSHSYFPYFLPVILILGLFLLYKKLFHLWVVGTLFTVSSFGLILKSNYHLGWQVFYGSWVPYLIYTQVILIIVVYLFIWLLYNLKFIKNNSLILWFIPLSFGLDGIIQVLRFSYISGKYYFGFAPDNLRFVGFSLSKPFSLDFINRDFPSFLASALLRFDFTKIWDNLYLSLLVYPLVHVLLALILGYFIIKLPYRIREILIGVFIILTAWHLINIFQADPRLVQ